MIRRILGLMTALVWTSLLLSCAAAPPSMMPGAPLAAGELVGRVVTAKIDLPLRRAMLVYGNGEIDFGVYRTKLEALGPSIRRYERARITKAKRSGNQLELSLNSGGWWGGTKNSLRWKLPQQLNAEGALIVVDYGHPPTPDEARPERVAYALRDVLEIEGVGAPAAARPLSEPMAPAVATGVTLLSVEAQPSRVPRGQPLNLTVHFEVTGATTGQPLSLIINRQLYQGETPLFSAPGLSRGTGRQGSTPLSSPSRSRLPPRPACTASRHGWGMTGRRNHVRPCLRCWRGEDKRTEEPCPGDFNAEDSSGNNLVQCECYPPGANPLAPNSLPTSPNRPGAPRAKPPQRPCLWPESCFSPHGRPAWPVGHH